MNEPWREEKQLPRYRVVVQPIACKGRAGAPRVLWGRDTGAVVSTRGSCGKGCGRRGEHSRAGELS